MLSDIAAKIEAILFSSNSPVSERELKDALNISIHDISIALNEIENELKNSGHGIILKFLAGGWVLETGENFFEAVSNFRDFNRKRKINLSRAAIETVAVVAYNQPVTRSEIDEIRGVRSDGVVSRLLETGLIKISGRKKKGNISTLSYKTTQKFLELFGLETIEDLPELEEFNN